MVLSRGHQKQRNPEQIEILYTLTTQGDQSISELSSLLNTHRKNIYSSMKILKEINCVKVDKTRTVKSGSPEKIYQITQEGLRWLYDEPSITLDQFWEIMFITYVAKRSKTNIQYEDWLQHYEEKVLNIKIKNTPTLWSDSVKNLSEIYQKPLKFNSKLLVLYILGMNEILSFKEIIEKCNKKTKSLPDEIIIINEKMLEDMINEKIIFSNKAKFQISITGFVLLLNYLDSAYLLKESESMKFININNDLKKILKKSHGLIPYFSKLCIEIPDIVKDFSILNYFRDIFYQSTEMVYPIQNKGTKELIILERIMEDVNRTKITHECRTGYKIRAKLIQENKIQDEESPIYDKLRHMARISGFRVENEDDGVEKAIWKKIDIEIEKAIGNKMDFELFCHFLPKIKEWMGIDQHFQKQGKKNNYAGKKIKAWKRFLTKNPEKFCDWFDSWINDIADFEKENLKIIKEEMFLKL